MTQEERWQMRYDEVKSFIETNKRNPSKHSDEERGRYLNWLKHNRKLMKAGEMKTERVEMFREMMRLVEENKRINQWK